jgi:hypothetical protein
MLMPILALNSSNEKEKLTFTLMSKNDYMYERDMQILIYLLEYTRMDISVIRILLI